MDSGTRARTVASTQMNATSSRAHTIFQIILTQTRIDRVAGTAKDKVRDLIMFQKKKRSRKSIYILFFLLIYRLLLLI
jgi:Kinesin motor domain